MLFTIPNSGLKMHKNSIPIAALEMMLGIIYAVRANSSKRYVWQGSKRKHADHHVNGTLQNDPKNVVAESLTE